MSTMTLFCQSISHLSARSSCFNSCNFFSIKNKMYSLINITIWSISKCYFIRIEECIIKNTLNFKVNDCNSPSLSSDRTETVSNRKSDRVCTIFQILRNIKTVLTLSSYSSSNCCTSDTPCSSTITGCISCIIYRGKVILDHCRVSC